MMRIAVLGVAVVMALAGCAGAGSAGQAGSDGAAGAGADPIASGGGGVAGMCAQDQPDCVDTPQLGDGGEPVPVDDESLEQFRRDAKFYLGKPQSELNELIRVGRVDDEQFALTEDYRIGRITVELDTPDGGGEPVVTSSTVEMPDGPETFTRRG